MDISKAKIKSYASLARHKQRQRMGLFVAEGAKCVAETLPFFQAEAIVASPDWLKRAQSLLKDTSCEVFTASAAQLAQISSLSTPPEVIAVYRMPELALPSPASLYSELVLVLDGVQDPGNLGTIMRTALWFGVRHIVASPQTADIFNPKAVQSTMGAIGRVHIAYTDLPEYILRYKEETGLPVYGTLLDGTDIYRQSLSPTGMIVMGNEGNGISEAVRPLLTSPLLIPSYPPGQPTVESLNVAMATAITLAEFRRQMY